MTNAQKLSANHAAHRFITPDSHENTCLAKPLRQLQTMSNPSIRLLEMATVVKEHTNTFQIHKTPNSFLIRLAKIIAKSPGT